MRKILFFLLCLIYHTSTGQKYAPFVEAKVKISDWNELPTLIKIPEKIQTGEKFPVIICFHGKSVAGNDLAKIFNEGIAKQIKEGKNILAKNSKDGKTYQFIIVAPLEAHWSFYPQNLNRYLDELIKKYPIDTTRIYLAGYSAGGWSVESAKTHNDRLSSRIAACITMSPADLEPDHYKRFTLVSKYEIPTWYFVGDKDDYFKTNTLKFISETNKLKKGLTKLTVYPGMHCCWSTYFNPNYKESGKNIYDWLIQYKKNNKISIK